MKEFLKTIEWTDEEGAWVYKEIAVDVSMLVGIAVSVVFIYQELM